MKGRVNFVKTGLVFSLRVKEGKNECTETGHGSFRGAEEAGKDPQSVWSLSGVK